MIDLEFWFKVKGEKHSVSKVRTLASVDIEAHTSLVGFVAATATVQRFKQGLSHLVGEQRKAFDANSLNDFTRWVWNDIVKEESDTLEASRLKLKELGGPICNVARKWYLTKLATQAQAGN